MDLDKLFSGVTSRKCLVRLATIKEATAKEMGDYVGVDKAQAFLQLRKLEDGKFLRSRDEGNRKYYSLNPDCPIFKELKTLLKKIAALEGDAPGSVD